MINYELSQLQDNPPWQDVLRAYADSVPDDQGWSARVHRVDGIANEHLPRIHGKLIAFGFLDFQLADRHEGVFYQLTSLGRQGLLRLRNTADADPSADHDAAEEPPATADEIDDEADVSQDASVGSPG